jgi:hypothetical protein
MTYLLASALAVLQASPMNCKFSIGYSIKCATDVILHATVMSHTLLPCLNVAQWY